MIWFISSFDNLEGIGLVWRWCIETLREQFFCLFVFFSHNGHHVQIREIWNATQSYKASFCTLFCDMMALRRGGWGHLNSPVKAQVRNSARRNWHNGKDLPRMTKKSIHYSCWLVELGLAGGLGQSNWFEPFWNEWNKGQESPHPPRSRTIWLVDVWEVRGEGGRGGQPQNASWSSDSGN